MLVGLVNFIGSTLVEILCFSEIDLRRPAHAGGLGELRRFDLGRNIMFFIGPISVEILTLVAFLH